MNRRRSPMRTWIVIGAGGLLSAAILLFLGHALVAWRFGNDAEALARLERETRQSFSQDAERLRRLARSLSATPAVSAELGRRESNVRQLFDILGRVASASDIAEPALTIFDADGDAVAWTGRPSELPEGRGQGDASVFVAPGALGLRLVAVEPVLTTDGVERRVGTVVAERLLSSSGPTVAGDTVVVDTALGPITLRRTFGERQEAAAPGFVLRAPDGAPLLEAIVPDDAPLQLRRTWQSRVRGLAAVVAAVTMLLLSAFVVFLRRGEARWKPATTLTLAALLSLAVARLLLWLAFPATNGPPESIRSGLAFTSDLLPFHRSPADLLITALLVCGAIVVLIDPVRAWMLGRRGQRLPFPGPPLGTVRALLVQVVAGVVVLGLQVGALALIDDTAQNALVNLLDFTVLPWEGSRLALLVGLILVQAAALWSGILVCRIALASWRTEVESRWRWLLPAAWIAPSAVAAIVWMPAIAYPVWPIWLTALTVAAVAYATRRGVPWYRRGSHSGRLGVQLVALVVAAWFLYPGLVHFVERAKRQLIETQYAQQASRYPEELQAYLKEALRQIDQFPGLTDIMTSLDASPRPSGEVAFTLWSNTDLEEFRLTSAIELYNPKGALGSRFALNFPEQDVQLQYKARGCSWEVFAEAAPFGADERRMLHAERGVCDAATGKVLGAIVVHVMLDYSALPFISSQSPYYEFIRASRPHARDRTAASDVELTIYGWGRSPIYTSLEETWVLTDDVFNRAYRSRNPFWTRLDRGDSPDHVFVSNDRNGIYVVGYPVFTPFNHLVHLGELTTLAALTFVALLGVAAVAGRILRRGPYPGELLVREVRASFYRKLFLAFVAATVLPVIGLSLLLRTYVESQLRNDVRAEAVRTASVARRVIEESLAIQRREGATPAVALSDDGMVWISRVIDQDVNIFEGPELLVTSERDLFASGLLPERTPEDVYRAVALQRLPDYVGQDRIGDFTYLVAATQVRVGDRDAILTVPLASQQRQIEREIDELNRGVHLGALLLILVGSALGYWLAERIGDPVQRLTRATRRIAAGDLSTRVVVRTADELERLVAAFNRMAGELQRQREQLERTNRLEAWAEMARQVAHDVKNPLTPIQLSAEHLRRVHDDHGKPLGSVLDNCVQTILTQVRLLRQISAEFSSFGSSPVADPVPTEVAALLHETVDPYRLALDGRVRIDLDASSRLPELRVDRMLIGRAIVNVIENALHAMPSGGTLTIDATQVGDHVRIALADTGIGMDEQAAARIFEPYFSTKATGTGLGLSIARRNVELHGGTIAVQSRRGEGTTVTISLPISSRPPA